jgi:hypothetical protein
MIKLEDNGKTNFYFDPFGMMLDRSDCNKHGQGDALWRTVLALIAAHGNKGIQQWILTSILKCLEKNKKGKYRFARHPERKGMDSSRDQNIMGMIALKIYFPELHKNVKKNLAFWISPWHCWVDAWFWAKEYYLLWRIISCYKFLFIRYDKSYSLHLFCWMILAPMNDFRWQRDSPWNEGKKLTAIQAAYNTLDLDVLNVIKDWFLTCANCGETITDDKKSFCSKSCEINYCRYH